MTGVQTCALPIYLAEDLAEAKDQLAARPDIAANLKKKLDAWEIDVRAPRLKDFA